MVDVLLRLRGDIPSLPQQGTARQVLEPPSRFAAERLALQWEK
jgi:hypothetical protein